MLIEPEISGTFSLVEPHLKEIGVNLSDIPYCVVLHEHYDHCMLLPWLKLKNPAMRILAPPGFNESYRKNFSFFKDCDRFTSRELGLCSIDEYIDFEAEEFVEGKHHTGVEFIHVPGHSPTSFALLFGNVVFVSDAFGYWGKEIECPLYFYRLSLYLESIKKIEALKPEVIITGHLSYFMSNDRITEKSLEKALEMRKYVLSMGFREEDAPKLFDRIYQGEFRLYPPEVILTCSKYLIKRSYEEVEL